MNIKDGKTEKVNGVAEIFHLAWETWGGNDKQKEPKACKVLLYLIKSTNNLQMRATERKNKGKILVNELLRSSEIWSETGSHGQQSRLIFHSCFFWPIEQNILSTLLQPSLLHYLHSYSTALRLLLTPASTASFSGDMIPPPFSMSTSCSTALCSVLQLPHICYCQAVLLTWRPRFAANQAGPKSSKCCFSLFHC